MLLHHDVSASMELLRRATFLLPLLLPGYRVALTDLAHLKYVYISAHINIANRKSLSLR
jgi:hypothetical protein